MAFNPWGSGAVSWPERAERAYHEIKRRIKLEAKNDPNFVPPANDASQILAARVHVLETPEPIPEPGDASSVIAKRVFSTRTSAVGSSENIPETLAERDAAGAFAAGLLTVEGLVATDTASSYDLVIYAPDGTTAVLRLLAGTRNWEAMGHFSVAERFGCNGATVQPPFPGGGAISATFTTTTPVGWSTVGEANAMLNLVTNIYDALKNNGIMT